MSWNFCGILLVLNVLCTVGTLGHNYESCPSGWMTYDGETPYVCVWVSDSSETTLDAAQSKCPELMESSLIMIQSERKFKFFKNIIANNLGKYSKVWIGLKKYDKLMWQTKEGLIEARTLPAGLQFNDWSYRSYNNDQGLIYSNGDLSRVNSGYSYSARFLCEKRSSCKRGWFGSSCDKQCHCHGQTCDPSDLEVTCFHGCHVGWMGQDCSQRKENADVNYFCVNSPDKGKYAQIIINTKGVHYDNIHAVEEDGQQASWCNNTSIAADKASGTETIKIFVDDNTINEIKSGNCAGKIAEDGRYEWQIKIQEKVGVVSRNDQEVHIHCNFSVGDTLSMVGKLAIKREKWFRKTDIKRPVEYIEEKRELIELNVVDSSTGLTLAKAHIGSPVALKIRFGLTDGNLATGVIPYNCDAASPDNEKKIRLLDRRGCPVSGSPVSGFSQNETKSLTTDSFPLFGFDGTTGLEFHCSYNLCFGTDKCLANCNSTTENYYYGTTENYHYGTTENYHYGTTENYHYGTTGNIWLYRHRRSAETTGQRLTGHIDVVFEDDDNSGTISSREREEQQRWTQIQASAASDNRMSCLGYLFHTIIAFAAVAVKSWSHQ